MNRLNRPPGSCLVFDKLVDALSLEPRDRWRPLARVGSRKQRVFRHRWRPPPASMNNGKPRRFAPWRPVAKTEIAKTTGFSGY